VAAVSLCHLPVGELCAAVDKVATLSHIGTVPGRHPRAWTRPERADSISCASESSVSQLISVATPSIQRRTCRRRLASILVEAASPPSHADWEVLCTVDRSSRAVTYSGGTWSKPVTITRAPVAQIGLLSLGEVLRRRRLQATPSSTSRLVVVADNIDPGTPWISLVPVGDLVCCSRQHLGVQVAATHDDRHSRCCLSRSRRSTGRHTVQVRG